MKDPNIGKLFHYLFPYRKQIAAVVTSTLACNIISILILYQFKAIIDRYVPERELIR
jgi:ABC-type bacteriocin/lantibiotic exporter with double-glycine peptidase domain